MAAKRSTAPPWLEPVAELAEAIATAVGQPTGQRSDPAVNAAARAMCMQHLVLLAASERGLTATPLPGAAVVSPAEYWRAFADLAISFRAAPHSARLFAPSWTDFAITYDTRQGSLAAAAAGAALAKFAAHFEAPPCLARRRDTPPARQPRASGRLSLSEAQIGSCFELLMAQRLTRDDGSIKFERVAARKQSGSFFTPSALAAEVVRSALELVRSVVSDERPFRARPLRVVDPAMGAGVFLIETCARLAQVSLRSPSTSSAAELSAARAQAARESIYGVDANPLAAAVAEACLWLFIGDPAVAIRDVGENLRVGDSLLAFDWGEEFPDIVRSGGFDLVVGNPPWVAFAGRAAQPLTVAERAAYRERFRAFRGYPTLQSLFVERAVTLATRGCVAFLLPSPLADLDGYAAAREVASGRHRVVQPLPEHGQDAFDGVVQPCFTLLLAPASPDHGSASPAPWQLSEKSRATDTRARVEVPAVLTRLAGMPRFPPELFREVGFQSAGEVSRTLFLRAKEADALHTMPLLQGRNVREFHQGKPGLFLRPDRELLRRSGCRLRDQTEYARVDFVIRQTAAFPIAALHCGLPFRNSLLAGFAYGGLNPDLVVGLLNSVLYRALHLSRQRDGRQAVFPQVKVSHLRSLPAPPDDATRCSLIESVTREATRCGVSVSTSASLGSPEPRDAPRLSGELRRQLDDAVFELFSVGHEDRAAVREFFAARTSRPKRTPVSVKLDPGQSPA